jgi:hypothetical protein
MAFESPTPDAGIVRIWFRSPRALAPDEVASLSKDIVANVPVAPSEVTVDPRGSGWIDYHADSDASSMILHRPQCGCDSTR